MNKKLYLTCTKPIMLLTELPLAVLLGFSIAFNSSSELLVKLYPLIITTVAAMVFIFIFFFRVISLSFEEIKIIGRFTSRDKAIICKGRTLKATLLKKNKLKLELFDDEGTAPELDFLKNDPSYKAIGLNIFREKAVFGKRALGRILKYYGLSDEDVQNVISCDTYECNYPAISVKSETVEELRAVSIEFTETV